MDDIGFIRLSARQRAKAIFNENSFYEILGPQYMLLMPWLEPHQNASQFNDSMIIARGKIGEKNALVITVDKEFNWESMGDVLGAKIDCALELSKKCSAHEQEVIAVLCLETDNVRLLEENHGLASINDIHLAVLRLSEYVPIIGIVSHSVGELDLSVITSLFKYMIVIKKNRFGLNSTHLIEQEEKVDAYKVSKDAFNWNMRRDQSISHHAFVDAVVDDSLNAIRAKTMHFINLRN